MRKIFLTFTLFALMSHGPANAADIPYKAQPLPTWTWTGFYVGGHTGYLRDSLSGTRLRTDTGEVEARSAKLQGPLAGFQAGYNFMLSPNLLLGLEADAAVINANADILGDRLHSFGDVNEKGAATLRGRVGVVAGDLLLFGTGGFAWSYLKASRGQIDPILGAIVSVEGASADRFGWTAGGGAEMRLWGNWTAKAEYRYVSYSASHLDFPTQQRLFTITAHTQAALLGLNYIFH